MKVRHSLVMLTMLLALGACRRESPSVTGSYGSGVLAGQVVLNGIDGTPEGVEVSVRDTGMRTVLASDGRFAFSGVPENAVLDFHRGDGINASLTVNGSKGGSIVVDLGRSRADKGSSRGNKRKDKHEFEGVIKTVNADSIVVLTSKNEEILIGLTTETVIRQGKTATLTVADLKPDMHVHVRARKVEENFVAEQVIVQGYDEGERPAVRQYEGTVVSASATELVINDSKKAEVKFALTAATVIRKGNTPVLPADLLPGQRVHVKATVAEDGAATAVEVIVQKERTPSTVKVSGTVVGVTGSDIKLKNKAAEVTVQTDASTRIRKQGKTISLSAIVAGDFVSAVGTSVSENTILASEVDVRGKSGHP